MEKAVKIILGVGLVATGGLILHKNHKKDGFWYGAGSILLIALGSNILFNKGTK
ncbi:MAG: hypothetical protein V4547_17785 [Bacteroidota bacterium]